MRHIETSGDYDKIVNDIAGAYPNAPARDLASALIASYRKDVEAWEHCVDLWGDGPIETDSWTYDETICPMSILVHKQCDAIEALHALETDLESAQSRVKMEDDDA